MTHRMPELAPIPVAPWQPGQQSMWPTNKNNAIVRIERKVDWIIQALLIIHNEEQQLMAMVQIDQAKLDDYAAKFEAVVAAVKDLLAHPQVQALPDAVTASVDQALTDAQSVVPPAPVPGA